ncbi:MAG: hypothetical protein ACXAC8_14665 [Candidatus Hodarchaeales archaeon]|jgi:hypothetical protein
MEIVEFSSTKREDWNINDIKLIDGSDYCFKLEDEDPIPLHIPLRSKNLLNYFREPSEIHLINT